jgi:capsular exopolysaccharide synthesis family protein
MGAAGVTGVVGGLGLMALLVLMDRSIRSMAAGERWLRMPGLAVVPRVKLHGARSWLKCRSDQDSDSAEAFRDLRAALGLAGRSPSPHSFLFTGARSGEGTSYVAFQFAASLAQQGCRTLIIDANVRAPVMDDLLLTERSPNGLADYLTGECGPDAKLCRQTSIPNLFLFSAGIPRAHPGEILNEAAFARLLQESLKWFHRIVIDTASVGQCADALSLTRHADSVCLVVRAGRTGKDEALKTVNRLTMAGARPSGFVLNAAPAQALKEGFTAEHGTAAGAAVLLPTLPPARA